MLLSLYSTSVAAASCPTEGEQPLEFRFFTDSKSWKDNGWTLECSYNDGSSPSLLWTTPIGSLKYDGSTEVILEEACIPDSATCTMRIFDASGDGLQGGNTEGNSYTGWFALLHGATTIGTYQNLEDSAFSELTYCVGPNCDQAPQEVQTNNEDCQDIVYLALQLDSKPEDTTYQLICGADKRVVWDGKGFTKAGAFVEEETCLPKDDCCEFVITDGDTNGLTSDVDVADPHLADGTKPQGFIYLERNFEPLVEYNGATGEEFAVLTKTFGSCAAEKTKEIESVDQDTVEAIEYLNQFFGERGTPETASTDNEEKAETPSEYLNEYLEEREQYDTESVETQFTVPPSSFGETDDYRNENDDGAGFGKWDDEYGDDDDAFTDDIEVWNTDEPTTWPTETAYPTESPTEERQPGDLYDDVVENDDADWDADDDAEWTEDELKHLEDLVAAADNSASRHPSDTKHDDSSKQLEGMQTGSKIAVGIVIPVLILWMVGLAIYMGRENLMERFGARSDDESLEKGTTASPHDESDASYGQDDLRSVLSLKEVTTV
eukprot:jgi/Psemu1/319789/estExt_fgenesh1_pm.C_2970002